MNTSLNSRSNRPLRLLVATAVLALAAGMVHTASAMPGGRPGHGEAGAMGLMGGMGGMGGRGMDRMFDAVGATAEQKAKIRQIMEAAHADLKSQREAGRLLREQGQALFVQPNVDARAVEDLRQKMLAQHDQASKRRMQAMLDASLVLTPDQRKQLAERATQRRSMMERQRAERESMDGLPRRP